MTQSFLFLPNENPKRPNIVPQEYLILNDDSLLQEDIPQCLSDPLPPIQPIASQPLGDCEKSFYHAIAKKLSLFLTLFSSSKRKCKRTQKHKLTIFKKNQQLTFLNQKVFLLLKKYKIKNN